MPDVIRKLNLGCGSKYNSDWTNIDFVSSSPSVLAHDLRDALPFPDGSFDVVYHSHVLEHFTQTQARLFLKECFRILVPGGILRIAVPDLEQIVREYIHQLERVIKSPPDVGAEADYDWIMLELYDQTVRNKPGGQMAEYLLSGNVPNEDYVLSRVGTEARRLLDIGKTPVTTTPTISGVPRQTSFISLLRGFVSPRRRLRSLFRRLLAVEDISHETTIGRFRESGEIHQWMYDEFSMARLLSAVDFIKIQRKRSNESAIPSWESENLDTNPDGSVYKPDSLFIEASKPGEL